MVLLDSRQISRVRRYSGAPQESADLSSTGLSPSAVALSSDFAGRSTRSRIGNSCVGCPTTPDKPKHVGFGLDPLSLSTTTGITVRFFYSRY